MDVLGTKDRWNKSDKQKIFDQWEQFLDIIQNGIKEIAKKYELSLDPTIFPMKFQSFSDTVLLTFPIKFVVMSEENNTIMESQASTNINFACDVAASLLVLGLAANLPFRGCISFGEFYQSERSINGDAIHEASQYYEQSNWIGVSLAPSAYKILQNNYDHRYISKCTIPLKTGIERNGRH